MNSMTEVSDGLSSQPGGYTFEHSGDRLTICLIDASPASDEHRIERSAVLLQELLDFYQGQEGKTFDIMFDILQMQNASNSVPSVMRKQYSQILHHDQTRKVAVVGKAEDQSGSVKFVLFLVKALGMNNVAWFGTHEEAEIWLEPQG